jgi:hypothetical protein
LQQITADLNEFQEMQAQITDYHTRLTSKVQQKEADLNGDMQHAANLWRYLIQYDEGIAMGKEDLRATSIEMAITSEQLVEVERDFEKLQKL